MTYQTEITRFKIENKLDKMIAIEILYSELFDGWACEVCGIILGEERKGVKKYYCEHLTKKVDKLFNPINKKITREAMFSTLQDGKGEKDG